MRRVVCDTGPLLHLQEAHALELLGLVGEIHIPPAVVGEVQRGNPGWTAPEWIVVGRVVGQHASEAVAWQQTGLLDQGEVEAVALARQLNAAWFVTDDAAARVMARSLGLEVHGSLGIVLASAAAG